jgi:hypothetical protein
MTNGGHVPIGPSIDLSNGTSHIFYGLRSIQHSGRSLDDMNNSSQNETLISMRDERLFVRLNFCPFYRRGDASAVMKFGPRWEMSESIADIVQSKVDLFLLIGLSVGNVE